MDDPFALIAAERCAFADLVDGLTPEQLAAPSLCEGWSVQDVAGHLAGTLTGSMGEFLVAMVRSGFSFARANTRVTKAHSAAPVAELVATLRERADSHFVPPGMTWTAPLADTMVHTQDVAVPLGLNVERPVSSWVLVLDFLVSPRARRGFVRGALPGVRLETADADWSHGDGPLVTGPAAALALAVMGRAARLDELAGPGADTLRAWATR